MMKQLIEHVHIHVNQHVRVMGFHVFFFIVELYTLLIFWKKKKCVKNIIWLPY